MNKSLSGGWKAYGSKGAGTGKFEGPQGIVAVGGYLWVTDPSTHRLIRLSMALTGSGWKTYGRRAWTDPGQFDLPVGLAVDGADLYVADQDAGRIIRLRTADLSFVSAYGRSGSGVGQFNHPGGIAARNGMLYVADTDNHRIVRFEPRPWTGAGGSRTEAGEWRGQVRHAGRHRRRRGPRLRRRHPQPPRRPAEQRPQRHGLAIVCRHSRATRRLTSPTSVAVADGTIFVADMVNEPIVALSAALDGTGWRVSGDWDVPADDYAWPQGIAVAGGSVFLTDTQGARIAKFRASDLAYLGSAGSRGAGDLQFDVPWGIAASGGLLYVGDGDGGSNPGNHRIVVWTTGD